MHLGNLFTALVSWLSVKSRGGRWILRIEDIDSQRSKQAFAEAVEDDLLWLGLVPDEGGLSGKGTAGPYLQSQRADIYTHYFNKLVATGYTYGCTCRRADILAANAPHQSDGRVVYRGTCRPQGMPRTDGNSTHKPGTAMRIFVPDREVRFTDLLQGEQEFNLARECGDFVVRRADGGWAYQFAVVVDDALMGVTEVLRGNDLLLSAAQQLYLYELLGFKAPQFAHVPLVCNSSGTRLSKRDSARSVEALRRRYSPESLLGVLANMAGIIPKPEPIGLSDLIPLYRPTYRLMGDKIIVPEYCADDAAESPRANGSGPDADTAQ